MLLPTFHEVSVPLVSEDSTAPAATVTRLAVFPKAVLLRIWNMPALMFTGPVNAELSALVIYWPGPVLLIVPSPEIDPDMNQNDVALLEFNSSVLLLVIATLLWKPLPVPTLMSFRTSEPPEPKVVVPE